MLCHDGATPSRLEGGRGITDGDKNSRVNNTIPNKPNANRVLRGIGLLVVSLVNGRITPRQA